MYYTKYIGVELTTLSTNVSSNISNFSSDIDDLINKNKNMTSEIDSIIQDLYNVHQEISKVCVFSLL